MLKGAYTYSQAKNMADEDGWTGLTWNYLPKYDDNFALAGFDRTHVAQMGWVYELPFFKDRNDAVGHDPRRLADQRRGGLVLGHAVLHRRHEQRHVVPRVADRS